ncbi:MAG: hypothetical protein N2593_00920 [Patescibacteria group bacterium]|nr:hypothetical protein [Patescibacteria group bacterium]
MKIFLSYSYQHKNKFKKLNNNLKKFLKTKFNIDSYSFVFEYKEKSNHKTMMKKALKLIDKSDFIIAELSYKSIGIGIEIGYAKAKNKKIIYIKKIDAEISTTSEGISDHLIEYKNEKDLLKKLSKIFDHLI